MGSFLQNKNWYLLYNQSHASITHRALFGGFHLDLWSSLLAESPILEYASQHLQLFISPTFQNKVCYLMATELIISVVSWAIELEVNLLDQNVNELEFELP